MNKEENMDSPLDSVMCPSRIRLVVLVEVSDTEISPVPVPSSRLSPPLTDFNKIMSFEGTI